MSEIRNEQQLSKAAAAESQRSADGQRDAIRLFGEAQTSQQQFSAEELQTALGDIWGTTTSRNKCHGVATVYESAT